MKKYILTSLLLLIVSFSHAQVPNYVPTNGLVGWWPFNGNANDESGNGNNGTVYGATLTTDRNGVANKAYGFDSNFSQFLQIAPSQSLNSLMETSISTWVYVSSNANYNHFVNKSDGANNHQFLLSNNFVGVYFYFGGGSQYFQTNILPPTNQWNHLVVTYSYGNQNNTCKFFLNGIEQESFVTSTLLTPSTFDLKFGSLGNNSINTVTGKMDDIAIYNRSLTQQEITNLYASAVPPTANITPSTAEICVGASTTLTASASTSNVSACASTDLPATLQNGLVGYWPFCGNANDASGNGNNGTVNGAMLTSDRFGNANSAYSFDGADDGINVGNLGVTVNYSVSFWLNNTDLSTFSYPIGFGVNSNNTVDLFKGYGVGFSSSFPPCGGLQSLRYFVYDATSTCVNWVQSSSNSIVNNWELITIVVSSNNTKIFSNGIEVANSNLLTLLGLINVTFGKRSDNFAYFTGKLDDIAIWNRAITAAEIQQLYNQGQTTYSWSPGGATTPSITVSPTSTTTYTCMSTINGQTATASQTITVNPLPAVNAGIDVNVCTGNSTTLNGSGASTYAWDNNVTNGVAFAPATSGTYTITGTDANGCVNSDQVLVTVNPLPTVNAGLDQMICAGTAITLNGSGASTYAWNNNVSNAVAFTPTTSGTYTVTGSDANGCINTDQVAVTVNPLPTVNAGSDQSVCTGTAVTLSASGANTYAWDNNVTDGIAFTPNATGTYSVTGTDGFGCTNTDQVAVTVTPLPTVNAGADQSVCAGTAVTLSASGASAYAWNNNVSNGVAFTPTASGTYSVTGTDGNGCTNTDQVAVTVTPLPTVNAGADQSVCAGVSVTLSASGANTYVWNNNVTDGIAFTPTASGTYSVTGTDGNGCINTDQVAVTVNPLPTVNAGADQSICKGAAVTLSGTGATTYAWNNNVTNGVAFNPIATATYSVSGTDANGCTNSDEVIVTVNEASASTITESAMDSYTLNGQTYTQSGTYTQTLTNAVGCDSTITLNLTLSFTGLGELAQAIRIFPNPANDILNIESTSPLIGEYTMYDAAGRVILHGTFTGMTTSIDVRNIAPGTYTLQAKELLERVVVLRR